MSEMLCTGCDKLHPTDSFGWGTYLSDLCYACRKEYRRQGKHKPNKKKFRRGIKTDKYGLTANDRKRLFAFQGNKCPICWTTTPNHSRGWARDHNHKTHALRGIICHKCNTKILGAADADTSTEILERAIAYIKNTPVDQSGIGKGNYVRN